MKLTKKHIIEGQVYEAGTTYGVIESTLVERFELRDAIISSINENFAQGYNVDDIGKILGNHISMSLNQSKIDSKFYDEFRKGLIKGLRS